MWSLIGVILTWIQRRALLLLCSESWLLFCSPCFYAGVTVPNRICCVAAGDMRLIYCRANLMVQFAREPKQLTILSFCRPPRGFIVCCLTAHIFSPPRLNRWAQNSIYTVARRMPIAALLQRSLASSREICRMKLAMCLVKTYTMKKYEVVVVYLHTFFIPLY